MAPKKKKDEKEEPVVLIDTREQKPFKFKAPFLTSTTTLDCGDYCLYSLPNVVIERKASVLEIHNNFTKGRERFFKEMDRARDNKKLLIILMEFGMPDLHKKSRYARINALMLQNTLTSIWLDYGFPYVYAGNRSNAQWWCNRFFLHLLKKKGL